MSNNNNNKSRRLDLHHGFIQNIRTQLKAQAAQDGRTSEPPTIQRNQSLVASHSPPSLSVTKSAIASTNMCQENQLEDAMMTNNKCRRLDLQHGFLQKIRSQLMAQAAQDGRLAESTPSASIQLIQSLPASTVLPSLNDEASVESTNLCKESKTSIDIPTLLKRIHLEGYVEEARSHIHQALLNPLNMPRCKLEAVGRVIVERAVFDSGYAETAALVCRHISQIERELDINCIPWRAFEGSVLQACKDTMANAEKIRAGCIENWISFVTFLTELYQILFVNHEKLVALRDLLIVAMKYLAYPPCIHNLEEVNTLSIIFQKCGKEFRETNLDEMQEIMYVIRDTIIGESPDVDISKMLLLLVELFASNWNLSRASRQFHFDI